MASHHYLIVQPVRMSTPNATEVRSVQLLQQVPPAVGLMIVSQVLRSLFRAIASLPNVEENPQDTQALNHKDQKQFSCFARCKTSRSDNNHHKQKKLELVHFRLIRRRFTQKIYDLVLIGKLSFVYLTIHDRFPSQVRNWGSRHFDCHTSSLSRQKYSVCLL